MKNKILKAVALAATAFLLLTAEGCPAEDPGKAGSKSVKHLITRDGEYKLTSNSSGDHFIILGKKQYKKMHMMSPSSSCKWATFYDTSGTQGIVIQQGDENNRTVNFNKEKRVWNKKTGKSYKLKATSFRTAGCGTWST